MSLLTKSTTSLLLVVWVIGTFTGPIVIGIVLGAIDAEDLNARTSYGVTISEATNIGNVNLAIVAAGMVVVLDDLIVIVQLSFCCLLFLLLDVFLYTDNFFYENSDSSLPKDDLHTKSALKSWKKNEATKNTILARTVQYST